MTTFIDSPGFFTIYLPLNWVVRGDCDHHQRSPEDDERRPKNEVGHEDKAGCGMYPGRFGHGHGRRPQTHPAEGQGASLSRTLVLVGLIENKSGSGLISTLLNESCSAVCVLPKVRAARRHLLCYTCTHMHPFTRTY